MKRERESKQWDWLTRIRFQNWSPAERNPRRRDERNLSQATAEWNHKSSGHADWLRLRPRELTLAATAIPWDGFQTVGHIQVEERTVW